MPGYRDHAVVPTKEGRGLLESHRDRDHEHQQTFYAGLVRERELEQDSRSIALTNRQRPVCWSAAPTSIVWSWITSRPDVPPVNSGPGQNIRANCGSPEQPHNDQNEDDDE